MEQEDIELIENAVGNIVKTYGISREEVLTYIEEKLKPSIKDGKGEREAWLLAIDKLLLFLLPQI